MISEKQLVINSPLNIGTNNYYFTEIHVVESSDYDKIILKFNEDKVEYHTYSNPNNKTKTFVVAGLHPEPRCLKCAAVHLTNDCTKSKDSPAKCANCGDNHPANSINCSDYIARVNYIEKRFNKNSKGIVKQTAKVYSPTKLEPRAVNSAPIVLNRTTNYTDALVGNRNNSKQIITNLAKDNNDIRHATTLAGFEQINEINNEIREINKLCNLNNMITMLRGFRAGLEKCNSQFEKFKLFVQLAVNLESDNGII